MAAGQARSEPCGKNVILQDAFAFPLKKLSQPEKQDSPLPVLGCEPANSKLVPVTPDKQL